MVLNVFGNLKQVRTDGAARPVLLRAGGLRICEVGVHVLGRFGLVYQEQGTFGPRAESRSRVRPCALERRAR